MDILVKNLPNIGIVLAKELADVGITYASELEKVGSAKALFLIRGSSGKGCTSMLYALEGAIKNIRWHGLSKEEKENAIKNFDEIISRNEQ